VRRALIVGIDEYDIQDSLSGCVNDAQSIEALLERHEDGSINFDCRLLTAGVGEQVTRANLRQAVVELFSPKAEMALLYFSGHGTDTDLGGYLVTTDSEQYDAGMPMSEVLSAANQSQVSEIAIILDCCNSGELGAVPAINNQNANIREGISILTASRPKEAAMESMNGGVFTTLVCGALDGGAADVMGIVTVAGVYSYVDEALGPWDQRPLYKAHVSRFEPLRRCTPSVETAVLQRLVDWFTTEVAEFALDPSFEPDAEPHNEVNEDIFRQLQTCRAAKLVEPVGEAHMYFAAMNSTSCRLTAVGKRYWRLARDGRF
jgi:Caspase domain